MDADDISLKNRLELQYIYLEKNPHICLVGCDSNLIDDNGNILLQKFKFYEDDSSIRKYLPIRNTILHPAIMIRTKTLIKAGGYKYGHMSEDHELFIRIARDKENRFHNIGQVLFLYRRHTAQITDISNARKNFCEISGFLFTEFLLTLNLRYILGMFVVSPLGRRAVKFLRSIQTTKIKQ
jgi:hypothetical protein